MDKEDVSRCKRNRMEISNQQMLKRRKITKRAIVRNDDIKEINTLWSMMACWIFFGDLAILQFHCQCLLSYLCWAPLVDSQCGTLPDCCRIYNGVSYADCIEARLQALILFAMSPRRNQDRPHCDFTNATSFADLRSRWRQSVYCKGVAYEEHYC